MILLGCAYTFSTGTTSAILVEMCKIEKKDLYHANTISWYLYYIACKPRKQIIRCTKRDVFLPFEVYPPRTKDRGFLH